MDVHRGRAGRLAGLQIVQVIPHHHHRRRRHSPLSSQLMDAVGFGLGKSLIAAKNVGCGKIAPDTDPMPPKTTIITISTDFMKSNELGLI